MKKAIPQKAVPQEAQVKGFFDLVSPGVVKFNVDYRCGNERYLLQVIAPDYKSALFGKAGGR